MVLFLTVKQRFLIPLQNENGTVLLVKRIEYLGYNGLHNVPLVHYIGTKFNINIETENMTKQEDYILVIDEEYNIEYSIDNSDII